MNIFENRVESFNNKHSKWPHMQKQFHQPETFARAGLYFTRRPKLADSLCCFLCDVELSEWKQGQSPFMRHAHESPECPWVVLDFPDNSSHDLDVDFITMRGLRIRNARLATFIKRNYWPPKSKSQKWPSAFKAVSAGFYFSPSQTHPAKIRCPCCHVEINEPIETNDILKIHKELNGDCIFLKSIKDSKRKASIATSEISDMKPPNQPEYIDESIWNNEPVCTPEANPTSKKPLVTYSKRASRKRAKESSGKSLKKQPKEKKQRVTLDSKDSAESHDLPLDTDCPSSEDIEQPKPAKKDKGKGRAGEPVEPVEPVRAATKMNLSKKKSKGPVVIITEISRNSSSSSSTKSTQHEVQDFKFSKKAHSSFGSCPYSPIQHQNDEIPQTLGVIQSTPVNNQEEEKIITKNTSPTLTHILDSVGLTQDQRKMTVEQFVHFLVERNMSALQKEGQEAIAKIKQKELQEYPDENE